MELKNFNEALIAHLQGKKVEAKHQSWTEFLPFGSSFAYTQLKDLTSIQYDNHYKFRIAPNTITVNGVEVPAPETVKPQCGTLYFIPALHECEDCDMWYEAEWRDSEFDNVMLSRGLVYLSKEDLIARAKAMLLFQN